MELPKIDFSKYEYPLKTLLLGNEDTWNSMLAIISDLTPEQFSYKHLNIEQRSIAEMINHALDTQYGFYTKHLVLNEEIPANLYEDAPKTAEEAQNRIVQIYKQIIELWKNMGQDNFKKEINTEWGQVLTGELALLQSITHTHYHVSEICFLRGLGDFPTKVMG